MIHERKHVDLFTGLGGFTLAAQANGVETIVQCEADEFVAKGLEKAWRLPVIRDVRKFQGRQWFRPWLLTAGVPCQPASRAGDQAGENDDRWLWPETLCAVKDSEPTWALFENPPGIDDVGLRGIVAQVEGLGYEVLIASIPACAVNSPQDRERYWIIARRLEALAGGSGQRCEGPRTSLRAGSDRHNAPRLAQGNLALCSVSGPERDISEVRRPAQRNGQNNGRGSSAKRAQDEPLAGGSSSRQKGSGQHSEPGADDRQDGGGVLEPVRAPESQPLADSKGLSEWSGLRASEQTRAGRRRLSDALSSWTNAQWVPYKTRRGAIEIRRAPTGLYSMADGLPSRLPKGVGARLIGALGNAVCWPVAAEIIRAMIEAEK